MNFLKSVCTTLVVAAATYLIAVNAFHPWQGLQITPRSDFELTVSLLLAAAAASVCLWRLLRGSSPGAELTRLWNATDDLDGSGR